jgi:hypothetical protein
MKDTLHSESLTFNVPDVGQGSAPNTHTGSVTDAELEMLTEAICDRLEVGLEQELERSGFASGDRHIFSRQMAVLHSLSSTHSAPIHLKPTRSVSLRHKAIQPNAIDELTQEIERCLYQQLVLERERQGRYRGCLSW